MQANYSQRISRLQFISSNISSLLVNSSKPSQERQRVNNVTFTKPVVSETQDLQEQKIKLEHDRKEFEESRAKIHRELAKMRKQNKLLKE